MQIVDNMPRPSWITFYTLDPRALNEQERGWSFTLPQARIDAITEVVNLDELKQALQEENGLDFLRNLFDELRLTNEMEAEDDAAQVSFVKHLIQNDGSDLVEKMLLDYKEEVHAKQKSEKGIKKKEALLEEQSLNAPVPQPIALKPQPNLVSKKKVSFKEIPSFERFLEWFDSKQNQNFTRPELADIYAVIRRLHCDDMIKYSDVELSDFLIERFSDGSYNVIANSAQYAGFRIMPAEINQTMKEAGEQAKGMVLVMFARDEKAEQLIHEQIKVSPGNPSTPFPSKPTPK